MTTIFVVAAVLVLIAGLFAVIVERTNERDAALNAFASRGKQITSRDEQIADLELALEVTRLAVRSLNKEAERLHLKLTESEIAGGKILRFPSIPPQRTDSWLEAVIDEQMLRPGDGA